MRTSKIDDEAFRKIAEKLGVPESEVRRAVLSFFDIILSESKALPFDNEKRIYTRDKFNEYQTCYTVPYIGRLGPVYSRYIKWRSNEANAFDRRPRSDYRRRITQDEIEHIAEDVLSGKAPSYHKKKGNEMYNRVWVVGKDGKKLAWQVIPKDK